MASRLDSGEARPAARPGRTGPRSYEHLGSAYTQPYRHARHRNQEPDWSQDRRRGSPGHRRTGKASRGRGQECSRRYLGIRGTTDPWPLCRSEHRSGARRALRAQHLRRAEHCGCPDRWRGDRRDGGGIAALPDQRALSARATRFPAGPSRLADSYRSRRSDPIRRRGRDPRRRWSLDDQERKCAPFGLGVRRPARQAHEHRGPGNAASGGRGVRLPSGYSISWSGQFEYLARTTERLKLVVPATLGIIFVLLYLTFRRFSDAALIMVTLPFALVGGYWLMFLLGYNMSVASAVGFIALGGVAAEIGIVMLVYLNQAVAARSAGGRLSDRSELDQAIVEGAALRIRPVAMTVAVIIAGLLPIMWGSGTGSEVMRRIAAPMVGGMITALLLSMLVIPSAYSLIHGRARAAWS